MVGDVPGIGIGIPELVLVFAVALVVLGPKRLPEIARQIGKVMGEVRRTTAELRHTLDVELLEEERAARRQAAEERRRQFRAQREKAAAERAAKPRAERPGPELAPDEMPRSVRLGKASSAAPDSAGGAAEDAAGAGRGESGAEAGQP